MDYEDIQMLHHLILPSTISDAAFFLDRLSWLIDLHKIYQHFFPEEYAIDNCQWTTAEDFVSSWELNLFRLINDNLFFLPESLVEGEEIFTMIPAYPIYPDWWDAELDDLPKSFQLVLCLSNQIGIELFGEVPDWLEKDFPVLDGVWNSDFLRLEALCKQVGEPLSILPKIVEILDHATGNIWLDATTEAYLEFDWTIQDIEILRAHWLDYQAIYSQVSELDEWLEVKENIAVLCQVFYDCDGEPPDTQTLITVLDNYL